MICFICVSVWTDTYVYMCTYAYTHVYVYMYDTYVYMCELCCDIKYVSA